MNNGELNIITHSSSENSIASFVLLTTVREFEGDDGVGSGPLSSLDPCTQIVDGGEVDIAGDDYDSSGSDAESVPFPLCTLHPTLEWNIPSSFHWVLHKVEELKKCVGITYNGYEE